MDYYRSILPQRRGPQQLGNIIFPAPRLFSNIRYTQKKKTSTEQQANEKYE